MALELGPQILGPNLAEPPRFPLGKDGSKGAADAGSESTKERARGRGAGDWAVSKGSPPRAPWVDGLVWTVPSPGYSRARTGRVGVSMRGAHFHS